MRGGVTQVSGQLAHISTVGAARSLLSPFTPLCRINYVSITQVAILDWDVHHGNGTQEIFYEVSPPVSYTHLTLPTN